VGRDNLFLVIVYFFHLQPSAYAGRTLILWTGRSRAESVALNSAGTSGVPIGLIAVGMTLRGDAIGNARVSHGALVRLQN
jgi:hypothetical protein